MMKVFQWIKRVSAFRWLMLAFVVKLLLLLLFTSALKPLHDFKLFNEGGDTYSYYPPIESFVDGNGYGSACRMPGLLPVYAPLYYCLGKEPAREVIVVLQFLLSVISVYVLAIIAQRIFRSRAAFVIAFLLYAISSFVSLWDLFGMADSFSTSFIIFSVYFFLSYLERRAWKAMFWSGIFIAWAIFLRPISGLLLPLGAVFILLDAFQHKHAFRKTLGIGLLFLTPFMGCESAWIARNFSKEHAFIPLQDAQENCFGWSAYAKPMAAIRSLLIDWGENMVYWESPTAEFFENAYHHNQDPRNFNPFKASRFFSSAYNLDSLLVLRANYLLAKDPSVGDSMHQLYSARVIRSANAFRQSYRYEHPWLTHVVNPNRLLLKCLFRSGFPKWRPLDAFVKMNVVYRSLFKCFVLLFNLMSFLGLAGLLLVCYKKQVLPMLVGIIPLAFLVVLVYLLGWIELRYLVPVYPFLVLFAAYVLALLTKPLQRFVPLAFMKQLK